jgi:hypothetical protein
MSSAPAHGEAGHVHSTHEEPASPGRGGSDLPMRRRDEESDWHNLTPGHCEMCTCTFYFAQDDPDIVWDPGPAWDEGCSDRECACHSAPVVGARRSGSAL